MLNGTYTTFMMLNGIYINLSRRIFHRPTTMKKPFCRHITVSTFDANSLLFFPKMMCREPSQVLCLKTSRILTRLFVVHSEGLSSFGQDAFVMTFPTPLLTSHVHPQDFVGLTTTVLFIEFGIPSFSKVQ